MASWSVKIRRLLLPGLLCGALLGSSSAAEPPSHKHSRSKKPPQVDTVPQFVPGPLPVVPLDQVPATAPQVSYQGGLLTISAENSSLGEILKAVRAKTGATIEVPGNASDRVVGRFGPGPARDVLDLLLNGSRFNYVLLGSATDPAAVSQIMLIAKSGGGGGTDGGAGFRGNPAANNPSQPVALPAPGNPGAQPPPEEAADAPEDNDNGNDNADNNAEADNQQQDQNGDQAAQAEGQEAQQDNGGQQNGPKTPEQILQELQQQQRLQQQQQQVPGQPPQPFQGPPIPRPPTPRPDLQRN